jgi:biofilm PGA synthesis N-glycosyltransferase PgaC
MGGAQVIFRHFRKLHDWRERRMRPIYLEYFTSMLWAYTMATTVILWALGKVVECRRRCRCQRCYPVSAVC